jgi:hypothetical protein
MQIQYTGNASVRRVGSYTWSKENKFIQDVKEVETAANLLTYPRDEFKAVGEVSKEVIKFLNNKSKSALVNIKKGDKK